MPGKAPKMARSPRSGSTKPAPKVSRSTKPNIPLRPEHEQLRDTGDMYAAHRAGAGPRPKD